MPTNAFNYDVAHIHQGPGDLWIIGGGVADSTSPILTLGPNGVPDNTAHPNSIHFGFSAGPSHLAIQPKYTPIMVEQGESPIAQYPEEIDVSLESELCQLDPTIMQACASFTVFNGLGGAGGKGLTVGGTATFITPQCVAFVAKKRIDPSKFIVMILFNGIGVSGVVSPVGRKAKSAYKVKFSGLQDLTRGVGRQTSIWYETT